MGMVGAAVGSVVVGVGVGEAVGPGVLVTFVGATVGAVVGPGVLATFVGASVGAVTAVGAAVGAGVGAIARLSVIVAGALSLMCLGSMPRCSASFSMSARSISSLSAPTWFGSSNCWSSTSAGSSETKRPSSTDSQNGCPASDWYLPLGHAVQDGAFVPV